VQALGGGQQGFGGRTAVVNAGAAQSVFFNEGHVAAGLGQGRSQWVAGLARTDNNGIKSSSGHKKRGKIEGTALHTAGLDNSAECWRNCTVEHL